MGNLRRMKRMICRWVRIGSFFTYLDDEFKHGAIREKRITSMYFNFFSPLAIAEILARWSQGCAEQHGEFNRSLIQILLHVRSDTCAGLSLSIGRVVPSALIQRT